MRENCGEREDDICTVLAEVRATEMSGCVDDVHAEVRTIEVSGCVD
jgi:hypothetical protein